MSILAYLLSLIFPDPLDTCPLCGEEITSEFHKEYHKIFCPGHDLEESEDA